MFTAKPVFVHIGFPKTGTTALQQNFFRQCPDTRYAGQPVVDTAIRSITDLDDAGWNAQLESTFRRVALLFGGREERVLISHEELSVGSLHGSADPDSIGRRLHLLFPRARVLVVLRNQLTLLGSLYGYAMTLPGIPHVSFNAWMDGLRSVPHSDRGLHLFDYAELLDLYASLFGRDGVEVLLYEDFVAAPEAFISNLARIIGVDEHDAVSLPNREVNVRPSLRTVRALKLAERRPWTRQVVAALPAAVQGELNRLARRGPALDTRFSFENEAFVRDYYATGNERLAELQSVDLGARGYPVP